MDFEELTNLNGASVSNDFYHGVGDECNTWFVNNSKAMEKAGEALIPQAAFMAKYKQLLIRYMANDFHTAKGSMIDVID